MLLKAESSLIQANCFWFLRYEDYSGLLADSVVHFMEKQICSYFQTVLHKSHNLKKTMFTLCQNNPNFAKDISFFILVGSLCDI